VLMRKDPPFDSEYFYATHLLEQAEREGARVFNKPARCATTRKSSRSWSSAVRTAHAGDPLAEAIRAFHAEHRDIILKPLDGMGGMGIFRVGPDGMNLGSIIETLNRTAHTSVMVQRYLPEIVDGDKRLLLIGGQPSRPMCWRAFRRAARCAATWPPAARAWPSR
jgi:glutathione synthase